MPPARVLVLVPAVLAVLVLLLNHLRQPATVWFSGGGAPPQLLRGRLLPIGDRGGNLGVADAGTSALDTQAPMPQPVLGSICEAAEFAPGAPKLNVTIVVFAWRRLASLQRLVESLQNAEYCKHRVPLRLFIDGGALPSVKAYVQSVAWPHGPVTLHTYADGASLGIRGMWINATSP